MRFKKSQTSTEFILLIGITFIIVFVIGLQQVSKSNEIYKKKESELVYDLALKLQEEIRTASIVEDGYFRNFTIPGRLENFDYTIVMDSRFLSVGSNNSLYTVRIPNVTGQIFKGHNIITKSGGAVYIAQ